MSVEYADFKLFVLGTKGNYTVQAIGPGGINIDPIPFVFEKNPELVSKVEHLKWGLKHPERTQAELMREVGSSLFNALFPRRIIRAFERSYKGDTIPRLKLRIVPLELNDLPWEMLYDPDEETFLASRRSMPIVRMVESSSGVDPWSGKRAPRILYIQANPGKTRELETSQSEQVIQKAYAGVKSIYEAKTDDLRESMLEPYDILHYDGHAKFDQKQDAGHLYLHDAEGQQHPISGKLLSSFVAGANLRLVVLAACETAVEDKEKSFSGIAQNLMHTVDGLPAVVAMQFAIPDASAIAFTDGFYQALAAGYPVDVAATEGRKAILGTIKGNSFDSPHWVTPVVYMHTDDGDILKEISMEDTVMNDQKNDQDKREDSAGGLHIGGSVDTGGGDFTVGDKTVQGDEVHGDKVMGDKVGGDKISIGNVTDSNVAVGRGASVEVTQGISGEELNQLFLPLQQTIDQAPVEKQVEATQMANDLKKEVAKGDKAEDEKVAGLVQDLAKLVPGAVGVITSIFSTPAAGAAAGTVTQFILDRLDG